MILAGDIGGTNTRLAVFAEDGDPQHVQEFRSQEYAGLAQIVTEYLQRSGASFNRACFAVAGPVEKVQGYAVALGTNVWTVDQRKVAQALGVTPESVAVINDLAANAYGIDVLSPGKLLTLREGDQRAGHRAIISAGTGLGVAGLYWDGRRHHPIPSEAGHSNFGPRSAFEGDLLEYLADQDRKTFGGHVSWERVLSGPGLYNLFDFHRHRGLGRQTVRIREGTPPGEAAKAIAKAALDRSCERSSMSLDLLVSLYGCAAGNVALQFLCFGGLYVGGGIAPKIVDRLREPAFVEAFLDKGPLRQRVLEKISVRVILDEHTALRGAARYAREMI
jgi:glucokinase